MDESGNREGRDASGFQDALELAGAVYLVPHCATAVLAPIFVFVTLGQDQEQRLSHLNGSSAFGAIEFSGLKFLIICPFLGWGLHSGSYKIKRSFFHVQNLWISLMDCGKFNIV